MTTRAEPEWSHGVLPYAPLCTLKPVDDGIWWVDGPVARMSVGPVLLPFPTRSVVIRMRSGGLWIWSPIAPNADLFAAVDALGPVEHLVSPNRFHYASIAKWKAQYPKAKAWASPGVRERAASQKIDVSFDADLADAHWGGELEQLVFCGSRFVDEVVFFHRASSTLLLADLIIAIERERVQSKPKWIFSAVGVLAPGGTPLEVKASFIGRSSEARESLAKLRSWNPGRVIVGHGRSIVEDVPAQLDRAFAWLG